MLQQRSLSTRILLPFVGLDLAFQSLIYLGFLFAAGTRPNVGGLSPLAVILLVGGASSATWLLHMARHVRGIERRVGRAGDADDDAVRDLSRAIARVALTLSLGWAIKWVVEWSAFAVLVGSPDSRPAQCSFVLATFFGPLVLGHALVTVLTAPERRAVAALLGKRSLAPPPVPSLKARLVLYGLGL